MPKKIDLVEVKKTFYEKATEKEKTSYESKDSEKQEAYLRKWNREEYKKNNPTTKSVAMLQSKELTSVEHFLKAAKNITAKKKFTIQEITDIEKKIDDIKKKINESRFEAEKEAEAKRVTALQTKLINAKATAEKAKKEAEETEAELNRLGAPLEAPKKEAEAEQ